MTLAGYLLLAAACWCAFAWFFTRMFRLTKG